MATCTSFRDQFQALQDVEGRKDKLIQDILDQLEQLEEKLDQTTAQLEREGTSSAYYHRISKQQEGLLKKKEQETESNAFVSVLVDGDSMLFLDSLVQKGELGGQETAQQLRNAVVEYIRKEIPTLRPDLEILTRVYANVRGLSKAYRDGQVLERLDLLESFIRGFNSGHPLCDFIDAGSGKECADYKLRGSFQLQIADVHCKHIIFAASTDNGYARLLGPYSVDQAARERITMIEGPPFERELANLKGTLRTASFPTVFRDSKLQSRRPSATATAQLPPLSPKNASYAATVSYGGPNAQPALVQNTDTAATVPLVNTICWNSRGQRVDAPLKPSQQLVASLKNRKLCNLYHLLKSCPYDPCNHLHGPRLDPKQLEALRYIARLSPCPTGLECDDPYCVSGHRCPSQPCTRSQCRFSKEMHAVDIKIVESKSCDIV